MPHTPLAVSSKFSGKSGVDLYHDVIMEIDWSIGEVMKALKDNGLERNTLVIISSDNGPSLKQHNNAGSAGELREGKGTTFEGGHSVAGIFYMPKSIPAGRVCDDIAVQLDIFPTVARITGSTLPDYPLDGYDMWDLLSGKSKSHTRKDFYYYKDWSVEAYRCGDIKYNIEHKYRTSDYVNIPEGAEKLKVIQQLTPEAVYNLSKDRRERDEDNIIESNPEIKSEYKKRIKEFAESQSKIRFYAESVDDVTAKNKNK